MPHLIQLKQLGLPLKLMYYVSLQPYFENENLKISTQQNNMSNTNKLFLLDAMALVYRAYYALINSPRVTSQGRNMNAQFGFVSTLMDLIKKEQPTHMAVVWDTHAPTERHSDFEDYKANRQEAPEDLLSAIPDIKRLVAGFNITNLELDGYEADDIVGTLALKAGAEGYNVYMVTPDKDYGQLVRENVFIYKPGFKGGTYDILGPKEVCEKWNIQSIHQVIDILGLMGDAVDNIPGIPGVGEKTAAKLLATYHTLENVLEHAHEIKGKLGEKIMMGKESAILSKKLATIIINVPIACNIAELALVEYNKDLLMQIFAEFEFKTLGRRILGQEIPSVVNAVPDLFSNHNATTWANEESESTVVNFKTINNTSHNYILIDKEEDIAKFLREALLQNELCFDTETTHIDPMQASLVGMSFAWQAHTAYYLPCPQDLQKTNIILAVLQPLFDKQDILWIGQNLKYDMLVMKNYGIELKGSHFDTMIAHYVIEPEGKRNMDILSERFLNYQPVSIEQLIGKSGKGQLNMRDVDIEKVKEYAAEDADITLQLKHALQPLLQQNEVDELFTAVDNPLVPILARMEFEGIRLDVPFLNKFSNILSQEIAIAEKSVYEQAGVTFNLASPKQLGAVLFERMQLDEKAKKTKTGQYATGEDVLLKLRNKHPIVEAILKFREYAKLKSTYSDTLPLLVNPKTNRLHTSYNQAVVVTGRLSSNNPNLQNIPIKTALGKEIRKAFLAKDENHVLLSADYSQIELRVVAAVSGDQSMIAAFKEGKDIHIATAAKVYGIDESEVTNTMRRNAKAVNFGIIYGQSAFGLADSLGISRTEAKEIIDNYFAQYSAIKKYMDTSIQYAKEHGFVKTLKGRKIKLADINSANATVRSFAERVAINAPIQGSAADMIKIAMIDIDKALTIGKYRTKMLLQVHDELVFDVPKEELETIKALVIEKMENALLLPNDVPVIAAADFGDNWLDAH